MRSKWTGGDTAMLIVMIVLTMIAAYWFLVNCIFYISVQNIEKSYEQGYSYSTRTQPVEDGNKVQNRDSVYDSGNIIDFIVGGD
jgi:hypothetical protein